MKYLACLLLLFTITVKMPFMNKRVYRDILSYEASCAGFYSFTRNGKWIHVPVQWTIIEEE